MSRQPNGGFIGKENITDSTTASGVYTLSDAAQKVANNEYPTARYTPQRSLRFSAARSTYLNRTPTVAGNRKTWTWSGWVKRGALGSNRMIFNCDNGTTDATFGSISFLSSDSLNIGAYNIAWRVSTQVFRDPAAWYHIVVAFDTTQATAANRVKVYVNGVQITAFSTSNDPTLNTDYAINQAAVHNIGNAYFSFGYYDGYLAEVNFIGGQALTPASFGESDVRTGEWKPKRYAGTYGTNGFYLSFANNSSTSTLGLDDGTGLPGSGAGSNDWTSVNHSVSIGVNYDSMTDVPGVGSQVTNDTGNVTRGNFATLNPLANGGGTLASGNLNMTGASSAWGTRLSTIAVSSGKWYAEIIPTNASFTQGIMFGISDYITAPSSFLGNASTSYGYYGADGSLKYNGLNISSWGATVADNDLVGIALNLDAGTLEFYKNNVKQGSTITGIFGTFYIGVSCYGTATASANFGQRPFTYTPPAGFKSLCTTNLPEPTIKRPQDHFDIKLWTGNGGSQTIGNTSRKTDNYEISRSLRFNSANSDYLSRTPASIGNRKTWTWSGWIKRSAAGTAQTLFHCYDGVSSRRSEIAFNTNNTISWDQGGSSTSGLVDTTRTFTDVDTWYHIVAACDATNSIASDRAKLFVNGVLQPITISDDFDNADGLFNSTFQHQIGSQGGTTNFFNGYLAEVNFIDGQALTPESFGVYDVDGSWQAKRYIGTYGTNGFHLNFSDNSNTTATTLGKDQAGSNNWTPNNFSVTAGSTNDSMVDTPTNWGGDDVDSGGEVRGNYCVINSGDVPSNSGFSVSDGGLRVESTSTENRNHARATLGVSTGKWYWEILRVSGDRCQAGVANTSSNKNEYLGFEANGWGIYQLDGNTYNNQGGTSGSSYGSAWTAANDILMIALDMDTNRMWFGKNGTWFASGNPATGTNPAFSNVRGEVYPAIGDGSAAGVFAAYMNFGQRAFAYTPPTGFKSLNTKNLNEQFPFVNGPDLIWYKRRNSADNNRLFDSVRGPSKPIFSDLTLAESTESGVTSFNSNGFTLGLAGNETGNTYVGWCWNAGSRTVGNSDGTINSTIRANPTAGFSIVTYTGTGASATVGHGLGRSPQFIIGRSRTNAGFNWGVWHKSLQTLYGSAAWLRLNTTDSYLTSFDVFDPENNTSSVMGIGSEATMNFSGASVIAYCWSEIPGYSKFGNYTGNGSTDGPFIYTGFKPRWIMIKRTDTTNQWSIWDTSRNTFNAAGSNLWAESSEAQTTSSSYDVDILSTGFKLRNSHAGRNASSGNYIYIAFAEMPFRYSTSR
jgi:hypothetical protein